MDYNPVKGTHDVINVEANEYQAIENVLSSMAETYGYNQFRTPVIEHTELFTRSVGDSSDIVRKEMYTFADKGDRSITLRPEFTAGIVRSFVNGKLYATADLPVKAYYCGPTFRYERPQAGRYRQFNQFGIECLGLRSPYQDAEAIVLGYKSLIVLGFKNVVLKINSLGDDESKENYKKAIKEYFSPFIDKMCPDCKERFQLNPLRILDCKDPEDQEIIKNAPKMDDYLNDNSKNYFQTVIDMLDELEIPYEKDPGLVRGLDYYSDVVFEYHYFNENGKSIGALGAGGHYDKLIGQIGGGNLDGVGFAFGIERLHTVLKEEGLIPEVSLALDCFVMPLSNNELSYAYTLCDYIRNYGFKCDINLEPKSMKAQFKKAERKNAKFAIIVGEEEMNSNNVVVKDMSEKTQETIPVSAIIRYLDEKLSGEDDEDDCECSCGCHHEHGECHCHDDDEGCCCHESGEEHCCCHDGEGDGEEHCCCHHHKGE